MNAPEIRARLVDMGVDDTMTRTPEEFAAVVKSDLARFAKVVKDAGITLE
jgi:tripartite-type tricarboxylate transporter receptor subunit TctC